MKIWSIGNFMFILAAALIHFSGEAFSPLCYFSPWDVKTCKTIVTYHDGTTKEVTFQPKGKNLATCYGFGCHPVYCSTWRDDIKKSCKDAYHEMSRSEHESLFGEKGKTIESVRFEGCSRARGASGVLAPLDHIVRSLASPQYSQACTTDSPEEEFSVKKHIKDLWTQAQQLSHNYLRKASEVDTPRSLTETSA